jgi:hypothetical protein
MKIIKFYIFQSVFRFENKRIKLPIYKTQVKLKFGSL